MTPANEVLTSITALIAEPGLEKIVYVSKQVFPTEAHVFLEFAQDDIQNPDPRGMANALGNAKRAIANRVDTLLFAYGLAVRAKREQWNFPKKLEKLRLRGVTAPPVLQDMVTTPRNLMEHEYAIPAEPQEVQNTIGVAELYLGSTASYVERGFVRSALGPKGTDLSDIPEQDYLTPALGRFSILLDRDADRLIMNLEEESETVRFRDISEEEFGSLMLLIHAISRTGDVEIVGPLDEIEFVERFLGELN